MGGTIASGALRAPRLLGVFAHPDDEVFCAGGTFAKYCAAGAEAMVVSATRGEAGQIRDARVATRATLPAVRETELRQACAHLGVTQVHVWDHVDGTLADVGVERLADEVAEVARAFSPDVVVTFGAEGAYGHPDHITIGAAATSAMERLDDGAVRLYHSHFPARRLLLLEHLARWLVGLDRRFRGSVEFTRALSLFAEESTTMRFASDDVAIRWFPPGFTVVEQGEAATTLFLILSGAADVVRHEPGGTSDIVARLEPGEFFGELGIAEHAPRSADVVSVDGLTCLVLGGDEPRLYAGRGAGAQLVGALEAGEQEDVQHGATTVIDVREQVERKVAAIAAHRSQYPIAPEMFPLEMLRDMFGAEYFVRIRPRPVPETDLLGRALEGEREP